MTYQELLAKAPKGHTRVSLASHSRDVLTAAETLLGTDAQPSRLGRCWLRFFKLDASLWHKFHANLVAVCALHDWGKANQGFQDEVRGKRGAQAIRHEHLSALMIGLPQVAEWLQANKHLDVAIVLSTVMTHHLKAGFRIDGRYGFAVAQNAKRYVQTLCEHDDFAVLTDLATERLGLDRLDLRGVPTTWLFSRSTPSLREWREDVRRSFLSALNDAVRDDCERRRLLIALRAAVIAADAAGSALPRSGMTVDAWIREQFDEERYWNRSSVWKNVITPRTNYIMKMRGDDRLAPFPWIQFQIDAESLPRRALLLATCGSGKSLAAWRWIGQTAEDEPVGRVLFLYPTRATATEGFRDYVSWAPEAEAALMHGTAPFDLQDMFDNENDPRHGLAFEADQRLFALGYWPKRAFSATVDQFLSFMQHGYGSLCMLPVLADAVVVIDEVHSFDPGMFSALKAFLRAFDVPVLCMTATLTADRRDALQTECGLTLYNHKPGRLREIADTPRYRVTRAPTRDHAARCVREALSAGRRVLWVVNTVARCHEVVSTFIGAFSELDAEERLTTHDGVPLYCYHSRFRLRDRIARHEAIIDALRPSCSAGLGVTTQVCEMSLDLDVDVLVTEECPVTALIQRMGRCNRQQDARSLDTAGHVIIYEPADRMPYTNDDLTGLPEFLEHIVSNDVSQATLEHILGCVDFPPWLGDKAASFLASGAYAVGGESTFRQTEDYTRDSVLFDDVSTYLDAEPSRKPAFVVPVSRRIAKSRDDNSYPAHRRLPRYLAVAPTGHYHALIGFCDRPLNERVS